MRERLPRRRIWQLLGLGIAVVVALSLLVFGVPEYQRHLALEALIAEGNSVDRHASAHYSPDIFVRSRLPEWMSNRLPHRWVVTWFVRVHSIYPNSSVLSGLTSTERRCLALFPECESVIFSRPIGKEDCRRVAKLSHLDNMILTLPDGLGGLDSLRGSRFVTSAWLTSNHIDKAGLELLGSWSHLDDLSLTGLIELKSMPDGSKLPLLRRLELIHGTIRPEAAGGFQTQPFSNKELAVVATYPRLEYLTLAGIGNGGLAALPACPSLADADFSGDIRYSELQELKRFPKLEIARISSPVLYGECAKLYERDPSAFLEWEGEGEPYALKRETEQGRSVHVSVSDRLIHEGR